MKKTKKQKNKKIKLLKDPNFIPKNKNVRICIFIIFTLTCIISVFVLPIYVNYPYVYFCWFNVFLVAFLFYDQAFYVHAERYPLNDYLEYAFYPLKDALIKDKNELLIKIERHKGFFEAQLEEKRLIFDMRGCLYPLTIIRAYFVRQFTMPCINKYKLIKDTMAKNIYITKLFKAHINVRIIYTHNKKQKNFYLIKDGKTKMNIFMKAINGHGYITWYVGRGIRRVTHFTWMSEQHFVESKLYYSSNKRNAKK